MLHHRIIHIFIPTTLFGTLDNRVPLFCMGYAAKM